MVYLFIASCTNIEINSTVDTSNMVEIIAVETTYLMGYPDIDPGPYGNHWKASAQPQHEVTIEPFYLDITEVTVSDYVKVLNRLMDYPSTLNHLVNPLMPITFNPESGFSASSGYEDRPMNYISWYEAMSYCAQQNKRLPTEAEWELTAKGSDIENPRSVPWDGGGWGCHKAIYYTNETLCAERPEPVGSHPDGNTPEGISDLGGNVSEWVFDWLDLYSAEAQNNPIGPDSGTYKVLRGGGFRDSSDALRVTDRVAANPKSRSEGVGFRCSISSSTVGGTQ